jgi:hypothetical protein
VPIDLGANSCCRAEVTYTPVVHEPRLSGVGCYDNGCYVGPASYDARWNDPHSSIPNGCREFYMEARPYSSAHDFLMHASCCSLLEQFFHPRPIPLARLVEVCLSCPTEAEDGTYNVSWSPSYNYGKIFPLLHKYPWEESDISRNPYDLQPPTYHQDPWNIPILIRHLQNARLDESTQVGGKESRRARGKKRKLAQKSLLSSET